ncbi:uncharacterized protein EAF02_008548 [Botrytis sinoallii]|uniref:uncharacterized protein n=1 Tax=Botrytis sinoallii TaxID=1463999 RepID=UPI001900A6F7|nr:uncharacterized protein EAF02_008548 [Botrytis sinoallii]KAF7874571.1 hypothetical protein EAF02_008548 [Botrytis sinoallii]
MSPPQISVDIAMTLIRNGDTDFLIGYRNSIPDPRYLSMEQRKDVTPAVLEMPSLINSFTFISERSMTHWTEMLECCNLIIEKNILTQGTIDDDDDEDDGEDGNEVNNATQTALVSSSNIPVGSAILNPELSSVSTHSGSIILHSLFIGPLVVDPQALSIPAEVESLNLNDDLDVMEFELLNSVNNEGYGGCSLL